VTTFKTQIRQHSVALISLAIALGSLGYNTWRNEKTEANRNIRTAGIELLMKLGELDRVVFFSHYDKDTVRGNPRSGWAYVLTIRDLAALTDGAGHWHIHRAHSNLERALGQSWQGQ